MIGTVNQQNALKQHLTRLYGDDNTAQILPRMLELLEDYSQRIPAPKRTGWDQRDMVLISYADQIRAPDMKPLAALREFLVDHEYHQRINTVHLLPFFPYTSD